MKQAQRKLFHLVAAQEKKDEDLMLVPVSCWGKSRRHIMTLTRCSITKNVKYLNIIEVIDARDAA